MKLFIVKETYLDDDCNLGCNLYSYKVREEAIEKLKELHNSILENYSYDETPVDDYFKETYFDISLEEDCMIRTVCEIETIEI